MIKYTPVTDGSPEDSKLVLITGWYQNKPGAGRWTALARRVENVWMCDATGEMLYTPTHWCELPPYPES